MRIFASVILFMFAAPVIDAEKNERLEAAYELLDLTNMEWSLKRSTDQMLTIQLQQNPAMAPYKHILSEYFNRYMSYSVLKHDIAAIYAETFTAQELREIASFYRTPAGRKAIAKMPELMSKGAEMGAAKDRENIHELRAMIKREAERIEGEEGAMRVCFVLSCWGWV